MLPSQHDPRFPHWRSIRCRNGRNAIVVADDSRLTRVRYLLTFRPFSALPAAVRAGLSRRPHRAAAEPVQPAVLGHADLSRREPTASARDRSFPCCGSSAATRVSACACRSSAGCATTRPMATDAGADGRDHRSTNTRERIVGSGCRATKTRRAKRLHVSSVATTLFSTELDRSRPLPQADGAQLPDLDARRRADPRRPEREPRRHRTRAASGSWPAARSCTAFGFPPMRVGRHEVYWQRPLAACCVAGARRDATVGRRACRDTSPHTTCERPDYQRPVELYPRMLSREPHSRCAASDRPIDTTTTAIRRL